MDAPHIIVCYAEADKATAGKLLRSLSDKFYFALDNYHISQHADALATFKDAILLVLVTNNTASDAEVLNDIELALQQNMKIIPVKAEDCSVPSYLSNYFTFDLDALLNNQFDQFLNLIGFPVISSPTQMDAALGEYYPQVYPVPKGASVKKNIVKSIIEAINPFKKRTKFYRYDTAEDYELSSDDLRQAVPVGATAGEADGASDFSDEQESMGSSGTTTYKPFERINTTGTGNPPLRQMDPLLPPLFSPAPAAAPAAAKKGKVLYDIPDTMKVKTAHRCIVRIGRDEASVLDDDTFSPAVKIESIPISQVMAVDLLDISEPTHFDIKTISSGEQLVDDDSYSEWLFMVTPLTSGSFSLVLKVSVIKIIDGKERHKEMVFQKTIDIDAETAPVAQPAIRPVMSTPSTGLKDLEKERNVKEYDTPKVFISYAHADKIYFDIFVQYLRQHSRWDIWTDRHIEIGSDWYNQIQSSVAVTDLSVLLVSAGFISSAFIREHEFEKFSRLKAGKAGFIFVPILLRDVDFSRWEELAVMQLFVAYGDEYGVPESRGKMIPFAKLCRFDNAQQLIPNDNIDTYFKNLVHKAEKDWLAAKQAQQV